MENFSTIKEAYRKGTGDIFFSKEGRFVAISESERPKAVELVRAGYTRLPHHEVVEIATAQTLQAFKDSEGKGGVIVVVIEHNKTSNEQTLISKQKMYN